MNKGLIIHSHTAASSSQLPLSMQSEVVRIKPDSWPKAGGWQAFYEGKWRKVYAQVHRLYIIHMGKKLTIEIEGA